MEFITNIKEKILALDGTTIWVLEIFAIVLATAIAHFLVMNFIKKIAGGAKKTKNLWDDAMVFAAKRPIPLLIWVVGLVIAAEVAFSETDSAIFPLIYPARDLAIIFCVAWFTLRFANAMEKNMLLSGNFDATTVNAAGQILRVAIIITATLIAMQSLGFSIAGVLAAGGVGGLAVGFAAKDLLANFFGALMIYLDRPFAVGEWIRSPDKEIEGTVERIGWRQTIIRTFDQRPLFVPNSVFSTIVVENPSRMLNRRIYETIGLRYDDMKKVEKITKEVEEMLKNHPEIAKNRVLMVHLNKFGASSVDFFVYCLTKTTEWVKFHEIKQEIMLKIAKIIEKHDAEIAFPTTTIHTPELASLIESKNSKS